MMFLDFLFLLVPKLQLLCFALSFPHLPCLSFQCLFLLHWSDSAAPSAADQLPLLSTHAVPGSGGDRPAQMHALEHSEACQRALQGKPSRKRRVVSPARFPHPAATPHPNHWAWRCCSRPAPVCVFQLLPVLRAHPQHTNSG